MIDWSKQHCGVHQAPFDKVLELMPDLVDVLKTFPDDPSRFTWDVKVHMLMPRQFPCVPNWHVDNVPRVDGVQRFELVKPELPMYCWISGPPLTQFKHGFLTPKRWHRFTQLDEHRGTASGDFGWRGFIRATHVDIQAPKPEGHLRRHCQVYLDAETFQW
ncbi:hypothetical protein [Methylobacter sp.]|uniref:hypothetical protein n=1 Tax=Methylobacter sp. TaxID=2051955 RepID=UPI0012252B23|nr:hypothetical protein [Methylobacter sp.]TAK59497.1 MAG: hypothetical protein EPO18_20255 [Methylobacter sp.]